MAMPWDKKPYPGGLEIFYFDRPSLVHQFFILLSDLCSTVENKSFKEIKHFHYMTNTATHKNPYSGGHEIYNLTI